MSSQTLSALRGQFEIASKLAHVHLDTLTTRECLWRPAPIGLHVHRADDGVWQADWPERESYDIGPPSIAWLTWHIGFWWTMVLDHSFGMGSAGRSQICWPGDADGVRAWIASLEDAWLRSIETLSDKELQSQEHTRWPFEGRPFADVIAWVNLELTKNAAEIGFARFLFAAQTSRPAD